MRTKDQETCLKKGLVVHRWFGGYAYIWLRQHVAGALGRAITCCCAYSSRPLATRNTPLPTLVRSMPSSPSAQASLFRELKTLVRVAHLWRFTSGSVEGVLQHRLDAHRVSQDPTHNHQRGPLPRRTAITWPAACPDAGLADHLPCVFKPAKMPTTCSDASLASWSLRCVK